MKRLFAITLLVHCFALAEVTPSRGELDPRVRVVDYHPAQVVKIATFYGISTHVQFAGNETIRDVAIGDEHAWSVAIRNSHLFIKPKATNADTNITVITDRRTYQFALVVQPRPIKDSAAWRDPNLVFSLSFRYPEDEAAASAATANARGREVEAALAKDRLRAAADGGGNRDYWVAGSDEISPTAARDDGRFIYLTFSNNRDMPAVYAADAQGNEALVNTNVNGNEIVVQRLVGQLRLRKGSAAACLVNRSFDLDGGRDNDSGTISPDVRRVLKEAS